MKKSDYCKILYSLFLSYYLNEGNLKDVKKEFQFNFSFAEKLKVS